MLKALQKIAGVAVVFSVIFGTLGPTVVLAQATPTSDTTTESRDVGGTNITPADIENAINSPTPNLANTTAYIFYTISVIMTGTFRDRYNPGTPTSSLPTSLDQALASRGLLGGLGFMMGEVFRNQPASFEYYATDIIRNSRFGSPAYAQGIGFGALTPILGTWKAFRDVAYYLLTLMFIVTGFLILIRHKISGNMAVTVQNALPRLVLALILITFSYAIAGLIVDLMFLSLYFIIGIFENQIFDLEKFGSFSASPLGFTIGAESPRDLAFNTHLFSFTIRYIFSGSAYRAADSIASIVTQALGDVPLLDFILGGGEGPIGSLVSWIIAQIFAIIFAVALFIAMFRVFFQLIMSYAGFVMNVVMSPLLLLEMTIPGRDPWRGWVRNLIAGLLPFVVTVFMIFMALALTGVGTKPGIGYDPSRPADSGLRLPLVLAGDIRADAFIGILAMGFMLLLPESIKIAQELIGAKGGPLEQYREKAVSALKQGWQGSGAVPGGKTLAAGAVAGAGLGALAGVQRGVRGYQEAKAGGASTGRAAVSGLARGAAAVPIGVAVGAPTGLVVQGVQHTGGAIVKGLEKAGGAGLTKKLTGALREQWQATQEPRPTSPVSPLAREGGATSSTPASGTTTGPTLIPEQRDSAGRIISPPGAPRV